MPTPEELKAVYESLSWEQRNHINVDLMRSMPTVDFKSPREGNCKCGRPVWPPHCPACGSISRIGLEMASETLPDFDKMVMVRYAGLKCRKCTHRYSEAEPCDAPPPTKSMKDKRQYDKVIETVGQATRTDEERRKLVEALFKKKADEDAK